MVTSAIIAMVLVQRRDNAPEVGKPGPNFVAHAIQSDETFEVAKRKSSKPLVLIFGSCT